MVFYTVTQLSIRKGLINLNADIKERFTVHSEFIALAILLFNKYTYV